MSQTKKRQLKWEETKEGEFGKTKEEIQAEFQAHGLVSKGSNPIITDYVKIGTKLKYICSKQGCEFLLGL